MKIYLRCHQTNQTKPSDVLFIITRDREKLKIPYSRLRSWGFARIYAIIQPALSFEPPQWRIIQQDFGRLCRRSTAMLFTKPGSRHHHHHLMAGMSGVLILVWLNPASREPQMSPWERGTPTLLSGKLMWRESHLHVIITILLTSHDSRECSHWWNRVTLSGWHERHSGLSLWLSPIGVTLLS